MVNNKELYTFWKLVGKYKIVIPPIQRDYAQGLTSDDEVTQIRTTFLRSLIKSILGSKPLHLDFLYGRSDESGNLILLDGQQRITTLFLLHWLLAYQSGAIEMESTRKRILSFTYQNRISSRLFCQRLVNKAQINLSGVISDQIKDSHWYFKDWNKDPTVSGMLVVIDQLNGLLKRKPEFDSTKIWNDLTTTDLITFRFLDVGNFELTDELYVKMNARGKPLTRFENFKAWFIKHLRSIPLSPNIVNWETKFDKEWTDVFWNIREKGVFQVDEYFLKYLNACILNEYAGRLEKPPEKETEIFRRFTSSNLFIPFEIYQETKVFDQLGIDTIFAPLEKLAGIENQEALVSILHGKIPFQDAKYLPFESLLKQEITLARRVLFHALFVFITRNEGRPKDYSQITSLKLFQWMRVINNLVRNTSIERPQYINAVKTINRHKDHCLDIYPYLSSLNSANTLSGFSPVQVREEILKARLINQDPNREQRFLKFESHPYFEGQIMFLLILADAENDFDEQKFAEFGEKASELFSDVNKYSWKPKFLFQRALLSKTDYLFAAGSSHSFGLVFSPNSKLGFRQNILRVPQKPTEWRTKIFNAFKEVLENFDISNPTQSLENMISSSPPPDWRKGFVINPRLIEACGYNHYIRWRSKCEIYLLGSTTMTGYYKEYYSYWFYLDHLEKYKELKEGQQFPFAPFTKLGYRDVRGSRKKACAYLDGYHYKAHHFALDITFKPKWENDEWHGTFQLRFFDHNRLDFPREIITLLQSLGFSHGKPVNCYYLNALSQDIVLNKLIEISNVPWASSLG